MTALTRAAGTSAEHHRAAQLVFASMNAEATEAAGSLHDGLLQNLIAARYAIDRARRDAGSDGSGDAALREATSAITEAISQAREHLRWLRSPHTEEFDATVLPPVVAAVVSQVAASARRAVGGEPGHPEITARVDGADVRLVVETAGDSLPDVAARWSPVVELLGGELTCTANRLELRLPSGEPA